MSTSTLPESCLAPLTLHLRPDLFKALSDPTRLALLVRLARSPTPLTVGEAARCCGVHLSGVSRHLKLLRDAGVVEAAKHGREVAYRARIPELAAALRTVADTLEKCCAPGQCCRTTQGDCNEQD